MGSVKHSLLISLYVQIITTFVGLIAIFINLSEKDLVLRDILTMETIVQIIEFIFYLWFSYFYNKNVDKTDITKYRYYDWVLTTPLMLLSTIIYFEYNYYEKENRKLTFTGFIHDKSREILKIFAYNFLMLFVGYLQETGTINIWISTIVGFGFFYLTFSSIYNNFAIKSEKNMPIFYILVTLWGLYGIAAMLPLIQKNVSYNILDIFSKNFYGLFLVYIIWTKRIM